jgi:hypothetical protein
MEFVCHDGQLNEMVCFLSKEIAWRNRDPVSGYVWERQVGSPQVGEMGLGKQVYSEQKQPGEHNLLLTSGY